MFPPQRRNPQQPAPMQRQMPMHGPRFYRNMQRPRQQPQHFYPNISPQQNIPKKRAVWAAPFTNEEGKFDFSRTATSVDKFVKTFQQVSPYVAKMGSFFIK